jgi:hypothetical protein
MEGVQVDELTCGMHLNPTGDIFGSPPTRKRVRKADQKLESIDETSQPQKSPVRQNRAAATSTTDLHDEESDGPKKVPKGQINALAKMLSALRR